MEQSRIKKRIIKCRVLGLNEFDFDGAHYLIDGKKILLSEVNITDGEFIIPEEVSDFCRGENGDLMSPFRNCRNIKIINNSNITDFSYMFHNCYDLVSLDLTEFDTSKATNMEAMFSYCTSLSSLIFNLDTHNVKNMSGMFERCMELEHLSLDFDTSNVRNMRGMFNGCSGLRSIELNLNTGNVKDMSCMFLECSKLKKINLYLETSSVINMYSMFQNCAKLTELKLDFDTRNVENMSEMFAFCGSLKRLDLNFDTSSLIMMSDMFEGCTKIEEINLNSFRIPSDVNISRLVRDCKKLKRVIMKGTPIC